MNITPGTSTSGFKLIQHSRINEINSDVFLFEHEVLGCPLLAVKNEDANKTFSVAFNTIPTDSTGVAHILEHSVLMGSKKYPVKDVFGEINKGGLTTFLNAMTGSDVTYYPFATRNLQEYFNIMDVYCDVVFNPLLERTTFEQEGWHYHQEGEDTPLEFQGVVFNEMKGAFSDPIRLIFHHIFGGLMPMSTYAHESGGDPKNIPDLTYEQFCAFHKEHYHPSNAVIFLYGDAPLAEELQFLEENFLKAFPERGIRSTIEEGQQPTEPVFIQDSYAVDSLETKEKTFLAVGTHVSTVLEREQNAAFQVIANILFNSDGSPLKNAIVSSGLCKDFGGFYLSNSCFKTFMISYLVGSEPEHRDQFLELYNRTLKEMVADGLDHDLVLSELNKYEFNLREEASKAQRGLDLISKAMAAIKYGTDPFENLVSEELIRSLRKKATEEQYFEQLIKTYLIDNQATVTVTLVPDPDKQANNRGEEEERLENYAATLTKREKANLIARTRELMEAQQQPNSVETLSLLPQLSIGDLTSDIHFHSAVPTSMFDQSVLVSELETNHISYLDIGFDVSCLPAQFLPLLDIFGTIITEIGTNRLDYRQFAKEIATCTGSFSHSLTTYSRKPDLDQVKPVFWLHMKCLPDYLERALNLVAEILSDLSLENRARIREIVGREFAWAEHAAQSEGYSLASSRVFAQLSKAGQYNELFSGLSAYLGLKNLALDYDHQEERFLASLQEIAKLLFNRNNLLLALTADGQEVSKFSTLGSCLAESLATDQPVRHSLAEITLPKSEALITSAEVVFNVQGTTLLREGNGYNGHFEVLKTYLSRDYLWNTVRQMGGAYGCFIQFSQITGNMAVISYRDPQVRKTYEAYDSIPQIVEGLDIPEKVLQQLIIGTYGNFDPLHSAAGKGATARNEYLSGITPEFKKTRIEEILATKLVDLRSFAPHFSRAIPSSCRVSIGNRAKIEADKDLFTNLIEI